MRRAPSSLKIEAAERLGQKLYFDFSADFDRDSVQKIPVFHKLRRQLKSSAAHRRASRVSHGHVMSLNSRGRMDSVLTALHITKSRRDLKKHTTAV